MSKEESVIYQWDEAKNETNYRKHGVYFEEAQTVWADEMAHEFYDEEHSIPEEERYLKLGVSIRNHTLLIVFCERIGTEDEEVVRIISARKATKSERNIYEKGI